MPVRMFVVICLLFAFGEQVFAESEQPQTPTREALEAEVEAYEQQLEQVKAEATQYEQAYNAKRDEVRERRDAQRELRSAFTAQRKTHHEAWDTVRQLLIEGVQGNKLNEALANAKQATLVYEEQRAVYEKESAQLDAAIDKARSDQDTSYQAYRAGLDGVRDTSELLRAAQSALRSYDREGWFELYQSKKQQVALKRDLRRKQAEEDARVKAERAREAAEWEENWAKMSADEQALALSKLKSLVEVKQAENDAFAKQVDEMSAASRKLSDESRSASREYSHSARMARALSRKVRELERQEGDDPESKAALEAARAEYQIAQTNQASLKARSSELRDSQQKLNEEIRVLRLEYQAVRDDLNVLTKRQRAASAGRPVGKEAEQREKEQQVIRETWMLMTGKQVQWGENPFKGQAAQTSGTITNQGPNLRVYLDNENLHALYRLHGQARTLHLFDSNGKVLFDGPVNRLPDLIDASQEIFYLWEYLASRVQYNGR